MIMYKKKINKIKSYELKTNIKTIQSAKKKNEKIIKIHKDFHRNVCLACTCDCYCQCTRLVFIVCNY